MIPYKVKIQGEGIGIDWYIDNFRVNYYERNRDWVAAANLRIEEFRMRPVNWIVTNATPGSTLHVEMIKVTILFTILKINFFVIIKNWWKKKHKFHI